MIYRGGISINASKIRKNSSEHLLKGKRIRKSSVSKKSFKEFSNFILQYCSFTRTSAEYCALNEELIY